MLVNDIFIHLTEYEVEDKNSVIIMTHGLAEHSKRFEKQAKYFNDNNINVITYDLRGHGQSGGRRGKLKSYQLLVDDLHEIVLHAKDKYDNVFLLGHSLGGIVVNLYTVKYGNIKGVIILSSPTDYLKRTDTMRKIGYKWYDFMRIKTDFSHPCLSHDAHNIGDPLNLEYYHPSLVGEMLVKGIKVLNENLDKYNTPVLLIHGKSDKIVPYKMTTDFFDKISSVDKTIKLYEESYHDILHDIEHKEVLKDINKWVGDRR